MISLKRLKMWLSLHNDYAMRPKAYMPATKLRIRERVRLWANIVRQKRKEISFINS